MEGLKHLEAHKHQIRGIRDLGDLVLLRLVKDEGGLGDLHALDLSQDLEFLLQGEEVDDLFVLPAGLGPIRELEVVQGEVDEGGSVCEFVRYHLSLLLVERGGGLPRRTPVAGGGRLVNSPGLGTTRHSRTCG